MRARWWIVLVGLVLGFGCGSRAKTEDPAVAAARQASIATRPINDPPWAIGNDAPVTSSKPSPTPSASAKPVAKGDAGVAAPVAVVSKDAGVDAGKPAVVAKPDCLTMCAEARACIEKLAGTSVNCARECEKTKPDDLEKGLKCRAELAKSCEAWMTCLVGTGS